MSPQAELHRADPTLRRLAHWLPGAIVLAAGLGLWLLLGWIGSLDGRPDTRDALLLTFLGLAVVLSTAALSLGWLLWRAAASVDAEQRYPPSDMRTLRDVPLRHGPEAMRIARLLRVAAVLAAMLGVGVLIWAMLATRPLA
jgi:hypothetical protein